MPNLVSFTMNSQPYQNTTQLNLTHQAPNNLNFRQIQPSDIPIFTCYCLIFTTGFICNSLTIAVMACNPALHTLYNFLPLNLAVGDLISCIFSIAKLIFVLCADKSGGLSDLGAILVCRFFTTVIYFSIILSVLTVTAISIERYFGIVKPLVHRNMTTKRLRYFLLFVWPITIIGAALISGDLRIYETRYYCFFSANEKDWPFWKQIIGWIGLTFGYIVPFIDIIVVYSKIIIHTQQQKRECNIATAGENTLRERLVQERTRKLVRLLILITVVFSVAILPELMYFALILSDRKYIDAVLFYQIGIPTVAINAITPILYTLSNSTFRSATIRLIRCLRHGTRLQTHPLTTRTTGHTT